ncbi:MAG: glycosyltransferase family 4 protein [Prevotella sp.]|nr:glycosyltransferase family 4 protein [Prevotella sp.]
MKVALLVNHLALTGVNNVVLDLATQLVKYGHVCTVFHLKENAETMAFPCEVRVADVRMFQEYDVVHAHGLLPEIWVCRNRPRRCRAKCVTTLHCYCFQDLPDLYGPIKGYAMGLLYLWMKRPFDRVVCLSKDMMGYYGRFLQKRKLTYAYNTRSLMLDGSRSNSRDEKYQGKVVIGMNGVLIQRKGVDLMLQALSLLPDRFVLRLAGDGKERKRFEAMAESLGVADRVEFMGMVSQAWALLPQYDILALPSRSEGFPLALLEAAVYRKKVVVSDLPIVKECFNNHVDVEMFLLGEGAEGLKDAILKAENNSQLETNIQQLFQDKYSPECFYHRYMEIYG